MTAADSEIRSEQQHEIIVVGGGLVGGPLALALSGAGWQVALIERQATVEVPCDPLDQRCTALSAGSVDWLQSRGLWQSLSEVASPIRRVHVSQRGRFGAVRMDAQEQLLDALGYVVENRNFLNVLEPLLAASPVRQYTGDSVSSVQTSDKKIQLGLKSGTALTARLLIATDGVSSIVREALGIGIHQVDYEQAAVLGTIRLDGVHHDTAYERFTDSGALALLPRPENCMSFVECIDTSAQEHLGSLNNRAYCGHLQKRFGYRLGRFREMGPRSIVPLIRIEAEAQTGPRTLLLGNAARLLHPVAGQGYNLALRDVASFLKCLEEARLAGTDDAVVANMLDPGDASLLKEFAQRRRSDQRLVVAMTDLLARSFRGSTASLSHMRALALVGIDNIAPLRRGFARRSMGLAG